MFSIIFGFLASSFLLPQICHAESCADRIRRKTRKGDRRAKVLTVLKEHCDGSVAIGQ